MAQNVSELIRPLSGKLAWYEMSDLLEIADGDPANYLTDASGNAYDAGLIGAGPVVEHSAINGRPALYFDGASEPLQHEFLAPLGVRHVFVVALADGAAFDAYRGLISGMTTNSLLLGDNGQTKFFDLGFGGFNFYKSGESFPQNNQQAPFNAFELLEMSVTGGVSIDGIRIGQDKADPDRRWKGYIVEPLLFTEEKTLAERRRINLYYDLKYSLWKNFGVQGYELYFPSPAIMPEVLWARFYEAPTDWDAVTVKHTYDDDGASFSDATDTPPKRWEIGYTGLTPEQKNVFDAFADAVRRKHTFKFIDKWGEEHSGVRIESYERGHEAHKSKAHWVNIKLVKF